MPLPPSSGAGRVSTVEREREHGKRGSGRPWKGEREREREREHGKQGSGRPWKGGRERERESMESGGVEDHGRERETQREREREREREEGEREREREREREGERENMRVCVSSVQLTQVVQKYIHTKTKDSRKES